MIEPGIVTSVTYSDGVPSCDVRLIRTATEVPNVPVMRSHHGLFFVPEQEQKVQTVKMGDQRFIVGVLDRGANYDDPQLDEGEFSIKLGNNTEITISDNGNGLAIDISAADSVAIDADTVTINGTPFDEHTHQYDDTTIEDTGDGSGTSSSSTSSTSAPE